MKTLLLSPHSHVYPLTIAHPPQHHFILRWPQLPFNRTHKNSRLMAMAMATVDICSSVTNFSRYDYVGWALLCSCCCSFCCFYCCCRCCCCHYSLLFLVLTVLWELQVGQGVCHVGFYHNKLYVRLSHILFTIFCQGFWLALGLVEV